MIDLPFLGPPPPLLVILRKTMRPIILVGCTHPTPATPVLEHCHIVLCDLGVVPHTPCRSPHSGLNIYAFILPLVLECLPSRSHSEHISFRGWFPAEVLSLMLVRMGWILAAALLTGANRSSFSPGSTRSKFPSKPFPHIYPMGICLDYFCLA